MKPGVYYDMPAEEYHAAPGISSGQIKVARENLDAWRRKYIDKKDDSDKRHFVVGDAFHKLLMQPAEFGKLYKMDPGITTQKGNGNLLSPTEMITVSGMVKSIQNNQTSSKIFNGDGRPEVSIFAEIDGILFKVRVDWLFFDIVFDLKSTKSAQKWLFSRDCYSLGYFIQAALYLDVTRVFFPNVEEFVFVATEKTDPYYTAIYPASKKMIEAGRQEYLSTARKIQQALRENIFTGYNDDRVEEIDLPGYAYRDLGITDIDDF